MPRSRSIAAVTIGVVLALSACGGSGRPAGSATVITPDAASRGIVGFGRVASGSEEAQIDGSLDGFFADLAGRRGTAACLHLSADVRSEVAGLGQPGGATASGCGRALSKMVAGEPPVTRRAERNLVTVAVRLGGDRGFVVYRMAGAEEFLPLAHEGGAWKLAALGGSELPR